MLSFATSSFFYNFFRMIHCIPLCLCKASSLIGFRNQLYWRLLRDSHSYFSAKLRTSLEIFEINGILNRITYKE